MHLVPVLRFFAPEPSTAVRVKFFFRRKLMADCAACRGEHLKTMASSTLRLQYWAKGGSAAEGFERVQDNAYSISPGQPRNTPAWEPEDTMTATEDRAMPLRDHFRPPPIRRPHGRAFTASGRP